MSIYTESWNETVLRTFDEGYPLLMPRWGYVASAFILFLIGFFGFFLNLMVILLMLKDRQLWTPLNIILFNLVCSDFSVSVLGNPCTLISALFHRWIFGHRLCVLYGFFMALLGITSITTLTVLSFERYMMVTRPLSSRHLTCKGAVLSIALIWLYSLALTTPPLIGWGNYVNEAANISCSVNWHEQSMNTLTYILFLFAMGQIVPLSIISFCYINIVRTMKKNSQRLGRVSRAESKVTSMVFVMIISFTVAWTPYSIFALMEQFATEGIISPGAGVIPALVAKSSICYDPLIYVGMNSQFRQAIKRFFGIHNKSGHSQTERRFENTMMLPTHKMDLTRYNTESTININYRTNKEPNINITENLTEPLHNECFISLPKQSELSAIQENKTVSDAEKSGETIYDDDSNSSNNKIDVFGESCDNCNEPVLTIIDSERLIFTKSGSNIKGYGNKAFEEDRSYFNNTETEIICENSKQKKIKQSYSLDFKGVMNKTTKRKLSFESKLENFIQPKNIFKGSKVGKFFDQDYNKPSDCLKNYLCRFDNDHDDIDDV